MMGRAIREPGHDGRCATYLHYLEVARLEALEGLDISLEEIRRRGYLILATELAVRFHTPASPIFSLSREAVSV